MSSDASRVLVQYVIVRGDLASALKYSLGAVIAQACHAVTAVNKLYADDEETQAYLEDMDRMHKVVLQEKDGESLEALANKLKDAGVKHKLWVEQPENVPTCIATKPYKKEDIQSHFGHLKLMRSFK